MTSWGLGCGWLRDGQRTEVRPSILRAILIALMTLGLFFLVVTVASLPGCSGQPSSGIRGVVTIGPTAPVATAGTGSDSKPYAAKLLITPQGGLHLKRPTRVESGSDGSFRVNLVPGVYVIEADGAQSPPTLAPVTVKVAADRFADVKVDFDSGIR